MNFAEKAIEMKGTINEDHSLILDETLPVDGPKRVRVIILFPAEAEIEENDWMNAAASNDVFDFLNSPEEDIYTLTDGKPFHE